MTTTGLGTMETVTSEKGRGRGRMQPKCALRPEEQGRWMGAWTRSIDGQTGKIGGGTVSLSQRRTLGLYVARIARLTVRAAATTVC